jgi:hypothetical protein
MSSGDLIVREIAFFVALYFSVKLYREGIDGSPYLLFGFIAVLLGEGSKTIAFTVGPGQLWLPALVLTSLGFCFAAYGFTKLVRVAIKCK